MYSYVPVLYSSIYRIYPLKLVSANTGTSTLLVHCTRLAKHREIAGRER